MDGHPGPFPAPQDFQSLCRIRGERSLQGQPEWQEIPPGQQARALAGQFLRLPVMKEPPHEPRGTGGHVRSPEEHRQGQAQRPRSVPTALASACGTLSE